MARRRLSALQSMLWTFRTAVLTALVTGGAREAAATPSSAQMQALFEAIETRDKVGIVIPAPSTGHYDSPSVYQHNGTWYMQVVYFDDRGYQTQLFSADILLGPWTELGTILPYRAGWDSCQAAGYVGLQSLTFGDNTLLSHGGNYYLSYIGFDRCGYEPVGLATGMAWAPAPNQASAWTRRSTPILSPSDSSARWWERVSLYKSHIIKPPSAVGGYTYIMFLNATGDGGTNSGSEHIGAAGSNDLVTWTRYGSSPVVSPAGSYVNRVAGDPQVFRHSSGLYVMNYWGRENPNDINDVFDNFAASDDPALLAWTKWTGARTLVPSKPNTPGHFDFTYDNEVAHKPWIIKDGGIVYHFHSAKPTTGRLGIALAVSSLARNWSLEESGPTQTPPYWSTWCGSSGAHCDADYTETGGRHGTHRLTHWKNTPYQVYSYQEITGLANGTYQVKASVMSSSGQSAAYLSAKNYGGGGERTATIPGTGGYPNWQSIKIPAVNVTNGRLTVGIYSEANAGSWLSVDEIEVIPVGRNFGFEQATFPTQHPASWVSWCGASGSHCDADYTETGGHNSTYRLTHWKGSRYEVYTAQNIRDLENGLYTLKAWVTSNGYGATGGNGKAATAFMEVKDHGGTALKATIGSTGGYPNWQQITISNIQVTAGKATIGFYSNADVGTWRSIDNVEFFKQ
jgi:hypothetical protein